MSTRSPKKISEDLTKIDNPDLGFNTAALNKTPGFIIASLHELTNIEAVKPIQEWDVIQHRT